MATTIKAPKLVVYVNPPTQCDTCQGSLGTVFYDGKTIEGPWANMCHMCWQGLGVGVGLGKGQKYRRQVDGTFVKVAG